MASRKIFRNHPSMSCGGCGYRARLVQSGTNIVGPSASELSTFEVTWRCHCQNCSSSTADIELPERTTFLRCNMDKLQRPLNHMIPHWKQNQQNQQNQRSQVHSNSWWVGSWANSRQSCCSAITRWILDALNVVATFKSRGKQINHGYHGSMICRIMDVTAGCHLPMSAII